MFERTISLMAIPGDNPISEPSQDVLGRTRLAQVFAEQVLSLDASRGLVVGVLGPWGSGKTSFVNLVRSDLASKLIPIVDFNPWMFSGTDQLMQAFFMEVSAQLKLRKDLAPLGEDIEQYGDIFAGLGWLPLVGTWIERARMGSKLVGKILQDKKQGISGKRKTIEDALSKLEKPIVIVLDDIDRLTTEEIRAVFRLVRLTASFPNLVYILLFDRHRVETALAEDGIPGRDYLEKILQLAMDLPAVPELNLTQQLLSSIDEALEGIAQPGPFDEDRWPDILMETIRPLIRNMRDVRRYTAAVRFAVTALEGRVALVDVLALEATRTFVPDAFQRLSSSIDGLTTTSAYSGITESPHLREEVSTLLAIPGLNDGVGRSLIKLVFPAAERHVGGSGYTTSWLDSWMKSRRLAHREVLKYYLEHVVGEELSGFTKAEHAWPLLEDEAKFGSLMAGVDPEELESILNGLSLYGDEFRPAHVVPGVSTLLNLTGKIPERPRGFFDFGSQVVIGRVVYRLLSAVKDPAELLKKVKQILPKLHTLSAKLELIDDVGHRENVRHKLIDETAASELEDAWRDEVRLADAATLAAEPTLLRVLMVAKRQSRDSEPAVRLPESSALTVALLKSARSESKRQALGSRAVIRKPVLAWDVLVELCGGEEELVKRVNSLSPDDLQQDVEVVELFRRYEAGWRPESDRD